MSKLTPKQEKFVQCIISGLSQRESYKQAGYSVENKPGEYIDTRASELMKNSKVLARYEELMEEHKQKSLWTREESVNDLIWLKEQARTNIIQIGLKMANSNAFINAIKELNTIEDLYPKQKQDDKQQEKNVAEAIRGLVDGINSKTN